MGQLVDGEWWERGPEKKSADGSFVRRDTQFRERIEGRPDARFAADEGRYHLYVSDACPWCHRVIIARKLFGLEDAVPMHVVSPWALQEGWTFDTPEPLFGAHHVYELYARADPDYTGRATLPILWDTVHDTIVNNESAEIIRFFDQEFRPLHTRDVPTWTPADRIEAIDSINRWIYRSINNGVYRCGFARTQEAYDEAVTELFEALDRVEELLDGHDFLVGDSATEADWRLWVTLVRFDVVYHGHFKCNIRRIADYPNLKAFTRRLYDVPGVAETTSFSAIKTHYYGSHESINPHRIVPRGPTPDF